jgi:PAS domain S-box-containing protein
VTAEPDIPTASLRARILEQKFRILGEQLRFATSGSFIAAVTLVILLWGKSDHTILMTWLLVIICLMVVRVVLYSRIRQARQAGEPLTSFGHYLTALMVIYGLVWGGLPFQLLKPESNFIIAASLCVTIGVTAGALGSLAILRPAFWGFIITALAPIAIRFFSFGIFDFVIGGCLLIVFAVILMRFGVSQERILVDQIRANIAKDDLITTINQSRIDEKRTQEQVKAMLDSSPAGISIISSDGLVIYVNGNFMDMFGFRNADQIVGLSPVVCFVDPTDFAQVNDVISDFGEVSRFKVRQRRFGGHDWWCLLDMRPIVFNGSPAFISWRYDITNRVRIEEEALANADFLSLTLETIDQGVLVVDKAEQIVLFSSHACALTGVTAGFLENRPTLSALYERQKANGEFANVPTELCDHLANRAQLPSDGDLRSIEWQRADGSWVLESCHRNSQGWLVLTFQDITNLKLVEADAVKKARLLQLTLDNMGQGLTMYDQEWNLLVRNDRYRQHFDLPQKVFQTATNFDEIVGETLRRDYGDAELTARLKAVRQPSRMKEPWRRTFTRPNGRGIDLLSLPVPEGGFVVTSTDITERLRIEAEAVAARDAAEAAAQSKANFLATMSHEIRTPMNGVMTTAEILAQTPLDGEQQELVVRLQQSAKILLTTINDILDFSKIEAGKMSLDEVEFDPLDTIDQSLTLFQPVAEEKGLKLIFKPETPLPLHLIGDVGRFRQLLINLLGNAVKFSAKGHVVLSVNSESVSPDRAQLRISVRDTGIGISEAQMDALFDPFHQADASISRAFGGTGLGLAICKRICDLMGGEIGVSAVEPPDHGAHFWLDLPFKLSTNTDLDPQALEETDAFLDGRRIWFLGYQAEEVDGIRHMIAALGGTDHWVPVEAFATMSSKDIGAEAIDAVICDAQMGVDAFRVVDRVVAEASQKIPTILTVSAQHLNLWRAANMALNKAFDVQAIMTLPIEMRQLRQNLHLLIAGEGREIRPDISLYARNKIPRERFQAPSIEQARQHGTLILVVEDNEINQFVIGRLLDRLGLAFELAVNGKDAIDKIAANDYGIALVDVHMPVMDGFEMVTIARQRDFRSAQGAPLPILALTADVMVSVERSCLEAGMDGYLRKPIEVEKLLEAVSQYIPQALKIRQKLPIHENTDLDDGEIEQRSRGKRTRDKKPAPPSVPHFSPENAKTITNADNSDIDIFAEIDPNVFNPSQLAVIFENFDSHALGFLENAMKELDTKIKQLKTAAQTHDYKVTGQIAHELKSVSAMIGAAQLQDVMAAIQEHSESRDRGALQQIMPSLSETHQDLTAAYSMLMRRLHALVP